MLALLYPNLITVVGDAPHSAWRATGPDVYRMWRDAGLVDVVRFEEGRGGTTKYYHTNTIVIPYSLPESADDAIEEIAADMQPCEHCRPQTYETYVLLNVLRRAFVSVHRDVRVIRTPVTAALHLRTVHVRQ